MVRAILRSYVTSQIVVQVTNCKTNIRTEGGDEKVSQPLQIDAAAMML